MLVVMADDVEWLERFNTMHNCNLQIGDWVGYDEILTIDEFGEHTLENAIDDFNNRVAHGTAIWLKKVEDK